MSMRLRKAFGLIIVTMCLAMSSLAVKAEHLHTFTVYSRTLAYSETKPCVTNGCTVTIKYYETVYRCSCGETFVRSEVDDNNHSMNHNKN